MRTKLTSVIIHDGSPDSGTVSVVIPKGLPVQESCHPGKFEISEIAENDPDVDYRLWDYWYRIGIKLDREQVEDGYPIPKSLTWQGWVILAMIALCFVTPWFIPVALVIFFFLIRGLDKKNEEEWGPKNLP